MTNETIMIACPPYAEFKKAPEDQSHSNLIDCPKCTNKMWLSAKKKGVIRLAAFTDRDILLACYHCIKKMVEKDPDILSQSKMVEL